MASWLILMEASSGKSTLSDSATWRGEWNMASLLATSPRRFPSSSSFLAFGRLDRLYASSCAARGS